MRAARRKLNETIDRMLQAGHSVALISKETGASERTIFRMKAARHKQEVESDPLLAELEAILYGGPGAALPELPELPELAELEAILFPAPAPVVDAGPPLPTDDGLESFGDIDIEAELKALGFPALEDQLDQISRALGFPALEEQLEQVARALGLPSHEQQMEMLNQHLKASSTD